MARPKSWIRPDVEVKSDLDPGEGATDTGERIKWGGKERIVYTVTEPITKVVPLVDPQNGGRMYKRGAAGQTLNSVHTERIDTGETRTREFIVESLGNGMTTRVFKGFRPDPLEAERERKKQRRAEFTDALFERSEAAGGLDNLLEEVATAPTPKGKR